jgi:hypothetical protein
MNINQNKVNIIENTGKRHKHIYQDNFFHATSLNDFIVKFN